jgi:hypothetical protein
MSSRRAQGDSPPLALDITRQLVLETLRTAMALEEVMGSLLAELPESAFSGQDNGQVLLEMLVGSVHAAARAAGERDCLVATALVGAIRERVIDDLRAAAELAEKRR